MAWFPRFALLTGLAAGLGGLSAPAQALPAGTVPAMVAAQAELNAGSGLLQDVRWANRCRPVSVYRQDRYGRPVRVVRERCRRVWVGPGRGPRGPY